MADLDIQKSQGGAVERGRYFLFTLVVVVLGWIIAAANTGISYLALGMVAIPISTGLIGCCVLVIALRFLHHAWWLAFLSLLPAVFVLVGSVQYAPEAALDSRGVRETVRIAADSAAADGGSKHRFTLIGRSGELEETLDYDGDHPEWKVGDRIEIVSDPEGVVPLEATSDVDAGSQLGTLVMGVVGWTGITLLAGRRGFVRRRAGRRPAFEDVA
ncbi:hypothetical protein [Streptomyces sp. RKAG337]|uniref:hypothetical protein n=1 Tax=Streptomyces sp. RKAG337 TaxID=2893404 RepID=UPI0020349D9B|nr:hypothetical protein [Streptomyces sp. RKAG337]MCM2426813.1 hypothetical protein [Streptomyces sp. RKAG337]